MFDSIQSDWYFFKIRCRENKNAKEILVVFVTVICFTRLKSLVSKQRITSSPSQHIIIKRIRSPNPNYLHTEPIILQQL